MKRIRAFVLALLFAVLGLAACGEKTVPAPVPVFEEVEDGVSVLLLTFSGEDSALEAVGTVHNRTGKMQLTAPCFGEAEEAADGYVCTIPEAYFTLRKREVVDGVLVYWGTAYGMVTDDAGHKKLYTLDESLSEQTWTDFYNRALRWQKKNPEATGGTGLV